MRHEQQIMAGVADLPISLTKSCGDEQHVKVIRGGSAAWPSPRAFDPVGRAGYEAPKASAQFR
jgi:hypothetical protein